MSEYKVTVTHLASKDEMVQIVPDKQHAALAVIAAYIATTATAMAAGHRLQPKQERINTEDITLSVELVNGDGKPEVTITAEPYDATLAPTSKHIH